MTETRIFFATDLRAADRCFRKFLNAAEAYAADVLILGGNLAGTRIVPIVRASSGRWRAALNGSATVLNTQRDVEDLEKHAADLGVYTFRSDPDELKMLDDEPGEVEKIFRRLASDRLRRWLDLAEERPRRDSVRMFVNCGNDDPLELDALVEEAPTVSLCDGRALPLDERRTLVSMSHANPTPWRCEREAPEDQLSAILTQAMNGAGESGGQLIVHTHCPPFDSELDAVPIVDDELRPQTEAGMEILGPSGSTAVREAIEQHQPILSLHGRALDSRGHVRIGRTLAVNPGSEYSDGILRGVIVDLDAQGVSHYLLTSG